MGSLESIMTNMQCIPKSVTFWFQVHYPFNFDNTTNLLSTIEESHATIEIQRSRVWILLFRYLRWIHERTPERQEGREMGLQKLDAREQASGWHHSRRPCMSPCRSKQSLPCSAPFKGPLSALARRGSIGGWGPARLRMATGRVWFGWNVWAPKIKNHT